MLRSPPNRLSFFEKVDTYRRLKKFRPRKEKAELGEPSSHREDEETSSVISEAARCCQRQVAGPSPRPWHCWQLYSSRRTVSWLEVPTSSTASRSSAPERRGRASTTKIPSHRPPAATSPTLKMPRLGITGIKCTYVFDQLSHRLAVDASLK